MIIEGINFNKRLRIGLGLLFLFGLAHRVLQLWLIWPQLAVSINLVPDNQVMQLLPKIIMSKHPFWGLWFLQQCPPIPNVIWAIALAVTQSSLKLAIIFILFQAMLSCLSAVVMALLLVRLGMRWWFGLLSAVIFLLGSDLLMLEYSQWGQFYYEIITMLFGLFSCHAALSIVRTKTWQSAFFLGFSVAIMALTRASFSFFWMPVLVWLISVGLWRNSRLILIYLFPILFLQGGWAFKNFVAHNYWSWTTSSWGGANLQQGERNRNGFRFNQWMSAQKAVCASPWHEMTIASQSYFFFMPTAWEILLPPAATLPSDVFSQDQYIAEKRGAPAILDSVAARIWSQCLSKEFAHYWRAQPEILIKGTWRSYKIFWLPIRQFAVTQPFPIRAEMDVYAEGVHWMRALRDAWGEWDAGYSIRQAPAKLAPVDPADYAATKVIALPFFASFISDFNLVILHSLPLLMIGAMCVKRHIEWPKGFSFLLLMYGYLASLSSIVEYGENMRFRINVEPIIWALCAVIALAWLRLFKRRRTDRLSGVD